MHNDYCVVITTCPDKALAERIANALLEKKLAACIQVSSIDSYYTWKGVVAHEPEQLLLIKAKASLYVEIEECIRANHTYDIPEIIQLPIKAGAATYLSWIDEASKGKTT